MKLPSVRRRKNWRHDLVVDLEAEPMVTVVQPGPFQVGEVLVKVRATGAHLERRRRRWGRVR